MKTFYSPPRESKETYTTLSVKNVLPSTQFYFPVPKYSLTFLFAALTKRKKKKVGKKIGKGFFDYYMNTLLVGKLTWKQICYEICFS